MTNFLTLVQIRAQFQGEWILLEDPQTAASLEVTGGQVLWHSKDRDEVYRKARELSPKHSAIIYTGHLPDDAAVIL